MLCWSCTHQEDDLRSNTNTGQWLDIQKAAATAEGRNSPIFKGSLGMYRGVVLHSHHNVIRFDDYGAGSNYEAARCSWDRKPSSGLWFAGYKPAVRLERGDARQRRQGRHHVVPRSGEPRRSHSRWAIVWRRTSA